MHLFAKIIAAAFTVWVAISCKHQESSALHEADPTSCRIQGPCESSLPVIPPASGFKSLYNKGIATFGKPMHRGRDVFAMEGAPIWIQAKFAYGVTDADLKAEDVDIYMAEQCQGVWKKLGSAVTSKDGQNQTVDDVVDTGGRIYAELGSLGVNRLEVGRHRVVLVVKGDNSTTELYINVLAKGAHVVVTDIDGTLTSSEMAAATEVIGVHPAAHPGAAEMMQNLYKRGYSIFYLTARPEWLMAQTRSWLTEKGFPPGILHTTLSKVGANGAAASNFKIQELAGLKRNTGIIPSYAFGNKPSDVKAFGESQINPKNSFYYKIEGDTGGGVGHDDYNSLLEFANKTPLGCK